MPRRERILVEELIERGMPELVEELLVDAPLMQQAHVARAYASAARDEDDPGRRKQFADSAEKCYRAVLDLENDNEWNHGLRRAFAIAQWHAEFADFLLTVACAPDLDQYEITSGLQFEKERLVSRLKEAETQQREARSRIDELMIDLRTQEEKFLLLGLSSKVEKLSEEQLISSAWTSVCLGMLCDAGTMGRTVRLDSALGIFDLLQRTADDEAGKYNATLGAGIALRELGRASESEAAFKRVIDSTMPASMVARARHEMARLFISRERYDRAKQELAALSATPGGREIPGASFYVQLAPLLLAYADILEAKTPHCPPTQKLQYSQRATQKLMEIADRGGFWTAVAQVYLALMDDLSRDPSEMNDDELFMNASRLMLSKKFEPALKAWGVYLARPSTAKRHGEAMFNLGVCQFQSGDHASAARTFSKVLEATPTGNLAERAAVLAYQCLREQAGISKKKENLVELANAAALLAGRFTENSLVPEARWVEGLALQEAGQFEGAVAAYKLIPRADEHYWEARFRSAQCTEASYEEKAPRLGNKERQRAAHGAAATWQKLVSDFDEKGAKAPAGSKKKNPSKAALAAIEGWERAARLAAAELYSSPELRRFEEGLAILPSDDDSPQALGLRLRCLRGAGREDEAEKVMQRLLDGKADAASMRTLLNLAAEMDRQILSLVAAGRLEQAHRVSQDVIPILRKLLKMLDDSATGRRDKEVVYFTLARALGIAGQVEEAREVYDLLVSKDPFNGAYIRAAALMEELALEPREAGSRVGDPERAEKYWARLLEDSSLRDKSGPEYWEARYYWLRHQLRHGRADLVAKGIASERVWYPDLGGPPWQARLLELAAKAEESRGGSP